MTADVSVIVATYGDDAWRDLAAAARESAANQDPPPREAVAWHHAGGGTIASVRNAAARSASADWLCFVDADDRLAPGYVAAMQAAYQRYFDSCVRDHVTAPITAVPPPVWPTVPPVLLVPAVQYVSPFGTDEGPPSIPAWDRNLLDINCAVVGTLIPRALFDHVGGFRELPSLEDWDLWLRAVRAGAKMVAVPDATYIVHRAVTGRNADQSPYHQLRGEHGPGFPWAALSFYKVAM